MFNCPKCGRFVKATKKGWTGQYPGAGHYFEEGEHCGLKLKADFTHYLTEFDATCSTISIDSIPYDPKNHKSIKSFD